MDVDEDALCVQVNNPYHRVLVSDLKGGIWPLLRAIEADAGRCSSSSSSRVVVATADYCFGEGSYTALFFPGSGGGSAATQIDRGQLYYQSDVWGHMECMFDVFVHADLKLLVWGANGVVEADIMHDYGFEEPAFVVPRQRFHGGLRGLQKVLRWCSYDVERVQEYLDSLFPGYRAAYATPQLVDALQHCWKRHVKGNISLHSDLEDAIQKNMQPSWLASCLDERSMDVERARSVADAWHDKWATCKMEPKVAPEHVHALPHSWGVRYALEVEHVLAPLDSDPAQAARCTPAVDM